MNFPTKNVFFLYQHYGKQRTAIKNLKRLGPLLDNHPLRLICCAWPAFGSPTFAQWLQNGWYETPGRGHADQESMTIQTDTKRWLTVCELENHHRNNGYTHEKMWFSIAMLVSHYQRVQTVHGLFESQLAWWNPTLSRIEVLRCYLWSRRLQGGTLYVLGTPLQSICRKKWDVQRY